MVALKKFQKWREAEVNEIIIIDYEHFGELLLLILIDRLHLLVFLIFVFTFYLP